MASPTISHLASVVSSLLGLIFASRNSFVPDACQRLEKTLVENVVGQDLASQQLIDAICRQVRDPEKPSKPLVVSAHGPPGVGKTMTHRLVARAVYGLDGVAETLGTTVPGGTANASKSGDGKVTEGAHEASMRVVEFERRVARECPGRHCPGYKVVYGMDFLSGEKDGQAESFKTSIVNHLRLHREAILVIEEYDKLNCNSRAILRQIIQNPEAADITMDRTIIFLESNLGTFITMDILKEAKGRRKEVTPEYCHTKLKDDIFSLWSASKCEGTADTLKTLNLIDIFVPYFPLDSTEIKKLIRLSLQQLAVKHAREWGEIRWEPGVVSFLLSKIDFYDGYPVDGGKEVDVAIVRHVDKALRRTKSGPACAREVLLYVDERKSALATNVVTHPREECKIDL